MWTTDGLTGSGGQDLFTFIFFGFVIYKACASKTIRKMILDTLAIPFVKEKNIKDRIQGFFIWLLVLFIAILLVGSWFASLIGIIKEFI